MIDRVSDTLRNRKVAAKVIKELDAFPKVPEDYQETSASGGTGNALKQGLFCKTSNLIFVKLYYYQFNIISILI